MKNVKFLIFFLLIYSIGYADEFDDFYLKAEKASNAFYPKLKSYKCDVKTSQFDIIMNKMTASMPKDLPRPERPELKKYWHHKRGMIILLEGRKVFPYMQEFSKKMIAQFALELNGFFLPLDKKKERDLLIRSAKKYVELKGDNVLLKVDFNDAMYVDGLFYKTGLPLPVQEVKSISFTINKYNGLINKMSITSGIEKIVTYELTAEYEKKENHHLLKVLKLSTDDNSVTAEFITEFGKINGYYLPVKQIRVLDGKDIPEEQRKITVEFTNYLLNKKIPEKIYKNER